MRATTRLAELERLAARIEVEIRREQERQRTEQANRPRRPAHRPPKRRPDDHGTERDYQAHRHAGEPACDLCKAGHSLYNQRRERARKEAGLVPQQRRPRLSLVPDEAEHDPEQLTIYDALKEA